jgi:hypothetical protein
LSYDRVTWFRKQNVIGAIPSPVMVAFGLLVAVGFVAIAGKPFRRSDSARTRRLVVARDYCVALVGVAIALVRWARPVGLAIGLIGVMGRLYFSILASLMRRADRPVP